MSGEPERPLEDPGEGPSHGPSKTPKPPQKRGPTWAQNPLLETTFYMQAKGTKDGSVIFGPVPRPSLDDVFQNKKD
ncbi:uncharacterized protein LOC144104816 isoform X2 [Amblyomma americanum]